MDERTDTQKNEQRIATPMGHIFNQWYVDDTLYEVSLGSDINFTKKNLDKKT